AGVGRRRDLGSGARRMRPPCGVRGPVGHRPGAGGNPRMTWSVPELGPSLGRLGDPALVVARSPLGVTLDDVRLELVTGVFDLAGAGRAFATAGDRDGAVTSLGRVAWLQLWERAVDTAAARISGAVNAHFGEAAGESRFPP